MIKFFRAKFHWLVIEKIKSNHTLYRLLSPIRAWQIKNAYRRTISYYKRLQVKGSCQELLQGRLSIPLEKRVSKFGDSKKLQILYVGTDYQQDSSGILQALATLGNLNYFTKTNGEYGQYLSRVIYQKYDPHSDAILDFQNQNAQRLLTLVDELSRKNQTPDIIIGQMWAGWIDGSALSEVRRQFGSIVINICMDDRQIYWGGRRLKETTGTYGLIPHIDLVATSSPECVEWYLKEKCPAIFFPEASDPDIFHPMPHLPKIYDISFVGGCYGIRKKLVEYLRKAGVQVEAWGSGWSNGRLPTAEVPKLFAQSKIVLGVGTISHCKDFYALKMRDFDAPMCGSLYLTQDNPDLKMVYRVGEEIAVYSSFDDCLEKIRYFLQNDSAREKIARAGWNRAQNEHTWEKRFHHLFNEVLQF